MKTKKVDIYRITESNEQTLGELFIDDEFFCYTLELPWLNNQRRISCIPANTYKVVRRWSQKHKNHFHITNVPNRDWILIHSGNYYTQILGCVLVGKELMDINADGVKDVTHSKATMKELNKILTEDFKLNIFQ